MSPAVVGAFVVFAVTLVTCAVLAVIGERRWPHSPTTCGRFPVDNREELTEVLRKAFPDAPPEFRERVVDAWMGRSWWRKLLILPPRRDPM